MVFSNLIKILEVVPEIPNQVDNILAQLFQNPLFIPTLATAIITILNFLITSLRSKKSINREARYDNRVVAIGKGVETLLGNFGNDIEKFIPLVERVLEKVENLEKSNELKDKYIVLLLQSANIPVRAKNDFLKALNNIDDIGIEDVSNNVKNAVNEELKVDIDNNEALEKEIADLKEW